MDMICCDLILIWTRESSAKCITRGNHFDSYSGMLMMQDAASCWWCFLFLLHICDIVASFPHLWWRPTFFNSTGQKQLTMCGHRSLTANRTDLHLISGLMALNFRATARSILGENVFSVHFCVPHSLAMPSSDVPSFGNNHFPFIETTVWRSFLWAN